MDVAQIEGALCRINLRMVGTLEFGEREVLAEVTRGLVEDLNAALARIWLFGPGDLCAACVQAPHCPNRASCLHLVASAGLSERLNGDYRRIPRGALHSPSGAKCSECSRCSRVEPCYKQSSTVWGYLRPRRPSLSRMLVSSRKCLSFRVASRPRTGT